MKFGPLLALLLTASALPNVAHAQFGAPPTDSYTLNILLQDASGKTLYKEARKCDPLRWCETEAKEILLNGQTRVLWVRPRWEFNMLVYQLGFKDKARPSYGASREQFPFRKKEKEVELFYNTPTGGANPNSPEFKAGPIAKLTLEIRY